MANFKKYLRRTGFILVLILASFGVGLSGGFPIPNFNRKGDSFATPIELVETKEDEGEVELLDFEQKKG